MNIKKPQILLNTFLFLLLNSTGLGYGYESKKEDFPPKDTDIYFITIGTGNDLHMLGGHSLIRLKNRKSYKDITINWGVFQDTDPDFFYKYLEGSLNYSCLESSTFSSLLFYKQIENRTIWQARLNITANQKEKILQQIWWWLRPENRNYQYHLLHNNCATIIRDILGEAIGPPFRKQYERSTQKTFRQIGYPYFKPYPIVSFAGPLLMTSEVDLTITAWQQFILPMETKKLLDESLAFNDHGANLDGQKLLVDKKRLHLGNDSVAPEYNYSHSINLFFLGLCLIILLLRTIRARRLVYQLMGLGIINYGLLASLGALGMIWLHFFSQHSFTYSNTNLLLMWPTDFLLILPGLYLLKGGVQFYKSLHKLRRATLAYTLAKITFSGIYLVIFTLELGTQDLSLIAQFYLPGSISLLLITGITCLRIKHSRKVV